MKYRKKPVVIEAYIADKEEIIHTLEGDMKASVGDYVITGIKGERYPCKPDIFEQTYEYYNEETENYINDNFSNPAQYNGGYFVFNPAESKPKKIYETYEEAYRDAREIAGKYTEAKVYVLQIVSEIKRESYIKTITTDKEGNISETFDNDKVPF